MFIGAFVGKIPTGGLAGGGGGGPSKLKRNSFPSSRLSCRDGFDWTTFKTAIFMS